MDSRPFAGEREWTGHGASLPHQEGAHQAQGGLRGKRVSQFAWASSIGPVRLSQRAYTNSSMRMLRLFSAACSVAPVAVAPGTLAIDAVYSPPVSRMLAAYCLPPTVVE